MVWHLSHPAPEAAILGIGKIEDKAVVRSGQIVAPAHPAIADL
ncbi:MAG: hypothetical protein U0401_10765 [Anaerolineae bacterium]